MYTWGKRRQQLEETPRNGARRCSSMSGKTSFQHGGGALQRGAHLHVKYWLGGLQCIWPHRPVCSLILKKINTIGANRRKILRLRCIKFAFCWGSLQRSPRSLYLRGLLLTGGGKEEGNGKGRKCKGERKERRWKEGFGPPKNFGL